MQDAASQPFDLLIIGAGFAGVGLGHEAMKAGFSNILILERSQRVGGTWRENTYPGAACDVPSHLYSFSFAPNPDWSRLFAPQPEILDYIERCATNFGLRPHIRFGAEVVRSTFDETTGLWTVHTASGDAFRTRFLVSGAGHALSKPALPAVKGLETFRGVTMHSAQWDPSVDLRGKRVAVIGTGASAMQLVPKVADQAAQLFVLQRTPGWLIPRPDFATPDVLKRTFRRLPVAQKLVRGLLYTYMEAFAVAYVLEPRLGRLRERGCKRYLYRTISDPEMRAKLTPNYRVGCKRILISSDYLPALKKPHVTLVAEALSELREQTLVTAGGTELAVDVIIFATGFESPEEKPPVEAIGLQGRSLHAEMKASPKAYLGATLPGFPNMFLVLGPNTGLGHSSMIYMMESQFRYIVDAMKKSRAHGWAFADLKPQVMERYQVWVQERLKRTVWNAGGCASWYLSKDGRNAISWPDFTFAFRLRTRRFDDENYTRHAATR